MTSKSAVGRVLIVGAGIAGLSTAVALARRGIEVTVIDKAGAAEGASIGITNRAVYALEELSVLDACTSQGCVITGAGSLFSNMLDSAGNPLPGPPPPPRDDTRLPSVVTIYRPELTRILREAAEAAGVTVRLGTTFRSLEDRGDHVACELDPGEHASFDLVVGADGTHSSVRRITHGAEVTPIYTGHMSLRWLIKDGPTPKPGFYTRSDNQMCVVGLLPNDWAYVAAGVDMENRRTSQPEARALMRQVLDAYEAPYLRALRDHLDDHQTIIARPYEWILVPDPWYLGRILLIGDAAHSSTAHLSSGGGMALEDAVVLAQELSSTADLSEALRHFMARRMPRVKLVVETGVKLVALQQAHADPAQSARLRSQAFAVLSQPY